MNQLKPTATVGPLPCPVGGFFAAPNVDKPLRLTRSSPQRSSMSGTSTAELQQLADKLRNEKLLQKQRKASKALLPQPGALRLPNESLAQSATDAAGSSELTSVVNDGGVKQRSSGLSLSLVVAEGAAAVVGPPPPPSANQNDNSTSSSTDPPVSPRGLNVNAPIFVPSSQQSSSALSARKSSVTTTTAVLPPAGRPFLVGINSQQAGAAVRRSSLQETTAAGTYANFKHIKPMFRLNQSDCDLNENATNNNNTFVKTGAAVGDITVSSEKLSTESVHQGSILPNSSSNVKGESQPVVRTCSLMTSSAAAAAVSLSDSLLLTKMKDLSRDQKMTPNADGMCSNLASGSPSPVDEDLSVLDDDDDEKAAAISDEAVAAAAEESAAAADLKKTYNRVDILRIYAQNKGSFPRPNCLSTEFNNASGVFDPSKWIQHIWALELANGLSYGTRLSKLPHLALSGPGPAAQGPATAAKGHAHPPSFISREEVLKNASTPMQQLLMQHAKKSS